MEKCAFPTGQDIVNESLKRIMARAGAEVACKQHAEGCDFLATEDAVEGHERVRTMRAAFSVVSRVVSSPNFWGLMILL